MSTFQFSTDRMTRIASLLASITVCCGCGGGKPWDSVQAVTGVVTYKGNPVKDADLAFFPLDSEFPESVRPWAKSKENGEFVLSTYNNGDGAPSGRYKVTVVHHEVTLSRDTLTTKPNDLPKKYASPETTDLTIEVKNGETKLEPFDLK